MCQQAESWSWGELTYWQDQGGGSVKEKNEKQEHLFGIMLDLNSVMTW